MARSQKPVECEEHYVHEHVKKIEEGRCRAERCIYWKNCCHLQDLVATASWKNALGTQICRSCFRRYSFYPSFGCHLVDCRCLGDASMPWRVFVIYPAVMCCEGG